MKTQRIVQIGFVVAALLVGIFLEHVLTALFGLATVTQPLTTPRFGTDATGSSSVWTYTSVIALLAAFGAALYAYSRQDAKAVSGEIVEELRKVSWPNMAETRAATIAVIVASVIAALLLGMFDVLWQFLTDKIQNPTL